MKRGFDWDDLYSDYEEKVENKEIDPKEISVEAYVQAAFEDLCAAAYDSFKDSYKERGIP